MEEFYHLCRLCLKNSHCYCDIFDCCLMEVINQVYELNICLNDGLPNFICVQCLSKVKEFLKLKTEAHKGRSALFHLKQKIEDKEAMETSGCSMRAVGAILPNSVEISEAMQVTVKKEPLEVSESCSGVVEGIFPDSSYILEDSCVTEFAVKQEPEQVPGRVHCPRMFQDYKFGEFKFEGSCSQEYIPEDIASKQFTPHEFTLPESVSYESLHEQTTANELSLPEDFTYKSLQREPVMYYSSHGPSNPQEPLLHQCDICGRNFSYTSSLKRHMLYHTGVRPFPCTVCEKHFIRKQYLVEHMRTHTGEKPYACEHCDWTFTMRSSLNRHFERKHSHELQFRCDECSFRFDKLKKLQKHKNKMHSKALQK